MVQNMMFNGQSLWCSFDKHNYLIVKLGVSVLLVGLAFRLLFSQSNEFSEVSDTSFLDKTISPLASDSDGFRENSDPIPDKEEYATNTAEKCDLFTGDWILNLTGPVYTNESCNFIESHQNCMKNGRPDTGYLYWRWNPRDCKLPQFNAQRFLEMMRNKAWALIGDSISRNHVQSLLCLLSKVEVTIRNYCRIFLVSSEINQH